MNDKALHFSNQPKKIEVRGAKVHNLKNIDVVIPLYGITGIAGVSGSGKSSLAFGVIYAEGSRRYYAEPGFQFYGAGFCALSLQ